MNIAMHIRDGTRGDLDAIMAIYDHVVMTSAATFDLEPLDSAQREQWIARFDDGREPLLVAEDQAGVIGFAYYVQFRGKPGYARSKETTVYVAERAQRRGVATALYAELIARARSAGVHVLVAGIGGHNPPSVALHERLGFQFVGRFREVGRKFGAWQDVEFWQMTL